VLFKEYGAVEMPVLSWVVPVLPPARQGGRPRTTNLRAVLNAIFYLLRTGCQWRMLPREFPPCGTVYHYFQAWQNSGVWVHLHRVLYEQARRHAGRAACPSAVIMDGQSVKTTERGGTRGFDVHKRVKGRKRHILVDTLGPLVANRVEPADTSDRRAGALLLGGLSALFPRIRTVIADGHESRKLARTLKQNQGWQLRIVKRRQRAFKITGLTWIVERSFAWLGRNRRLSKDYEYRVQTSEKMIDLASIRLMLNWISLRVRLFKHPLKELLRRGGFRHRWPLAPQGQLFKFAPEPSLLSLAQSLCGASGPRRFNLRSIPDGVSI
jgi:putative transposase